MYNFVNYIKTDQEEKKYQYSIVKQKLQNEYIGSYVTYGIQLKNSKITIDDVSCNKKEARKIANYLTAHQISPIHFQDVILDLIS